MTKIIDWDAKHKNSHSWRVQSIFICNLIGFMKIEAHRDALFKPLGQSVDKGGIKARHVKSKFCFYLVLCNYKKCHDLEGCCARNQSI